MPPARALEIADNFRGVNRREDRQSISRRELYDATNFFPATRGIAETRLGSARFNSTAVTGGIGREIARYYPAGGTRRKIVVFNLAAGDALYYGTDATGVLTAITGPTALTANTAWLFAEFQGNFYAGNATEVIQKSTNGTTRTDIGGSPALFIGYPAGPYRSRLLAFGNPTNPKRIAYTDTFTENAPADNYITIEHHEDPTAVHVFGRDDDQGVFGDLAIFTPTSTWIVRGDFKDIAGGYSLERVEERLGTLSPLSFMDTPYGLVGLGYDGTTDLIVVMIPHGGGRPVIISDKIRAIESLPRAYRNLANAVYYKGFYRLSFVPSGQTVPNREWWADLRSLDLRARGLNIEWWGPMTGRNIGAMAVQLGSGDANELIAADSNGGYIDNLDVADTYTDYGTAYTARFQTKDLDGGDPLHFKSFRGFVLGAKPTATESVSCDLDVDEGGAVQRTAVPMVVTSPTVGDATLVSDDTLVGGERFDEYVSHLASPLYGHRASIAVTYRAGRKFAIKRATPLAAPSKRLRA